MEGDSRNGNAMKLQDFVVPGEGDRWLSRGFRGKTGDHSEDKDALELSLGPPGEESRAEPCKKKGNQGASPFLSLGSCPSSYLQLCPGRRTSAGIMESSACCSEMEISLPEDGERKGAPFVPPPVDTAVQNNSSSQKRSAPAAVVGWPPIRSFRRNIASTSGGKQPCPETQNTVPKKAEVKKPAIVPSKGSFVKINMDGVPIGRKVDLESCKSYEKLATAVDDLFRVLLAAQTESSGHEAAKPITGLLDGTGEYTLVYEDYEGDRMLVGDVPWQMFVATAKRLRVLKRSDLSVINLGGRRQDKLPLESPSK